ncbi:hypothetical protein HC928_23760 [bacterium]|nr:hypothetical protein [bacterium]
MLCASTTFALQYFLFHSTLDLHTTLQPGRGTAIVRDGGGATLPPVLAPFTFSRGMSVRTDATDERAQASLLFQDQHGAGDIVATITLMNDSTLRLRGTLRPRFDWTVQNLYRVNLVDVSGEVDVYIASELHLPVEINLWTVDGTRIILNAGGHYTVSATGGAPELTNWAGQAVMIPPGSNTGQSVGAGQRGTLNAESGYVSLSDAPLNLVDNGEFTVFRPQGLADYASLPDQPVAWRCGRTANVMPSSRYEAAAAPDGRPALRLLRGDSAQSSAATWCEQSLDDFPLTGLTSLEVRATLYIAHQSISACGILATECPLMIQIDFAADSGRLPTLRHGLYARLDPAFAAWPLLCDTCGGRDHVRIYEDAWYTYESGNLLPFLRDPDNPDETFSLRSLRIYASGHEYEVYVAEVALIARAAESLDGGS